jgi:hypothetical protein
VPAAPGAQRRVGQRVEQHHVGLRQALRAAQRDQVGRAGAGADEDHAAQGLSRSSAPAAHQQRAAGAVAGRVDDDQRAADAVAGVGLHRQRLLQLDHHVADLVDGQLVRIDRLQVWMSSRWSICAMRACTQRLPWRTQYLRPTRRARCPARPAWPQSGASPAGCRAWPSSRRATRRAGGPARRRPTGRPAASTTLPARRTSATTARSPLGKTCTVVAGLHAAVGDAAPQHTRLVARAFAFAGHVLHRQAAGAVGALLRGRQAFQQLQQRGPWYQGGVQRRGDVVAAQRRHRHDAGHAMPASRQRPAARLTAAKAGPGSATASSLLTANTMLGTRSRCASSAVAACLRQQRHGSAASGRAW